MRSCGVTDRIVYKDIDGHVDRGRLGAGVRVNDHVPTAPPAPNVIFPVPEYNRVVGNLVG